MTEKGHFWTESILSDWRNKPNSSASKPLYEDLLHWYGCPVPVHMAVASQLGPSSVWSSGFLSVQLLSCAEHADGTQEEHTAAGGSLFGRIRRLSRTIQRNVCSASGLIIFARGEICPLMWRPHPRDAEKWEKAAGKCFTNPRSTNTQPAALLTC